MKYKDYYQILGGNIAGAALALELMDEIENLRKQIERKGPKTSGGDGQ